MTHLHENDELNAKVEQVSKKLKQAETKKIQADTELKTLRNQYQRVEKEMRATGVEPKEAKQLLGQMDDEIATLLAEVEGLLPASL